MENDIIWYHFFLFFFYCKISFFLKKVHFLSKTDVFLTFLAKFLALLKWYHIWSDDIIWYHMISSDMHHMRSSDIIWYHMISEHPYLSGTVDIIFFSLKILFKVSEKILNIQDLKMWSNIGFKQISNIVQCELNWCFDTKITIESKWKKFLALHS